MYSFEVAEHIPAKSRPAFVALIARATGVTHSIPFPIPISTAPPSYLHPHPHPLTPALPHASAPTVASGRTITPALRTRINAGRFLVFSAARPGQFGSGHQRDSMLPRREWIRLFAQQVRDGLGLVGMG